MMGSAGWRGAPPDAPLDASTAAARHQPSRAVLRPGKGADLSPAKAASRPPPNEAPSPRLSYRSRRLLDEGRSPRGRHG
jgi:hypothetical protein